MQTLESLNISAKYHQNWSL